MSGRCVSNRSRLAQAIHLRSRRIVAHMVLCEIGRTTAARCFRGAQELDESFYPSHFRLAQNLIQEDEFVAAKKEAELACQLSDDVPMVEALNGYCLGRMGRTKEAKAVAQRLRRKSSRKYVPDCAMALVSLGIDDLPGAMVHLKKAAVRHDVGLIDLLADPIYASVRKDSGFSSLMATVGLFGDAPLH